MKFTCSNKITVQQIIKSCIQYNVSHVVISPGSRNAPLTISFTNNSFFNCYSIPDERSAAFYALGMAKKLNEPVAMVCTSGTAVLNYAPAIAEAYYQEIPLIVITADRPPEWIDQEDGQTIRQDNIYQNYICYSGNLPKGNNAAEIDEATKIINKAFNVALANKMGPVHINMPFDEPLYETESIVYEIDKWNIVKEVTNVTQYKKLVDAWNNSEKVMILAGVLPVDHEINSIITDLIERKNAVVIAPSYSNLKHDKIISIPELIFNTVNNNVKNKLKPDLLITIGQSIVSKATKLFLREYKPNQHFDIDFNERRIDTYLSLTNKIISSHSKALNYVKLNRSVKTENYLNSFLSLQSEKYQKLSNLTEIPEKSDFATFSEIFNSLKTEIDLHLSNSTPIRYSELFKSKDNISYFCNRGTSGIDGNTSIAAGSALVSKKQTILITGDVGFGYDSNAFWNNHVPANFKVIVINNGGGNIFRIINGPTKSNSLEYFETPIKKSIQSFCSTFNIKYTQAKSALEVQEKVIQLIESSTCSVLEIITNPEESAETYKHIFRKLRE